MTTKRDLEELMKALDTDPEGHKTINKVKEVFGDKVAKSMVGATPLKKERD